MSLEPISSRVGVRPGTAVKPGSARGLGPMTRPAGDLVIYAAPGFEEPGGITAQYLNHWHEAGVGAVFADAPRYIHVADAAHAGDTRTFDGPITLDGDFKLIPIPGHKPG